MSVQDEREVVELPHQGDLAFGALMDALAPEGEAAGAAVPGGAGPADGGAGAVPAGAAAPAAGAGGNQAAAPGQPAPAAPGSSPADGGRNAAAGPDSAGKVEGRAEPPAGGAEQPAAIGQPAAVAETGVAPDIVLTQLGDLSTKFEETVTKAFQQQAYETAREDYEKYFEALEKHPRLLVGAQVPAIGKEGMETLRNSEDAKEWQEAVRSLLVEEIRANARAKIEENTAYMETIHASIDLFKNNVDLIPGTKGFNKSLADSFAAMAAPYEVRVDGKLQGYSIPVQPIIDNLRKNLQTAAASPAAAPAAAPIGNPRPTVEPPQAGIPSKAGSSSEREDFSTLFGTIGLPNLQI